MTLAATTLETDIAKHGPYWGVVLSAGITRDNAFPAMLDDDWDTVLDTNLGGFYNVLRPVVMPMVSARRGGRIVALSSISGIVGNRGQTNYSAAQGRYHWRQQGACGRTGEAEHHRELAWLQGLSRTQMTEALPLDKILDTIPMRRLGSPEDVAGAVAFLCSDDASYVTRQVISVNGGMI